MNLFVFRVKLNLLSIFLDELRNENVPNILQRELIKVYAGDLRIKLTDKMIEEIMAI
ncbi:MAG: hypothetical protein ACOYVK_01450 [Bacillota bacterium]